MSINKLVSSDVLNYLRKEKLDNKFKFLYT